MIGPVAGGCVGSYLLSGRANKVLTCIYMLSWLEVGLALAMLCKCLISHMTSDFVKIEQSEYKTQIS